MPIPDSQSGCTALIRAATNGHAACVRLIINAGADEEAKDNVRVAPFSRSLLLAS
jgi:hypothetical protein